MKMERLPIQVGDDFRAFISVLTPPMAVNEMRTMKEPNYGDLRKLLTKQKGGEILRMFHKFADILGMDNSIFDLVFESFWDVYLFNGKILDGASGKKMLAWIPKVKLHVNETTVNDEKEEAAAENEEGEEPKKVEESGESLTAIVRIKLGKKIPEPEMDEDDNVIEKDIPEE